MTETTTLKRLTPRQREHLGRLVRAYVRLSTANDRPVPVDSRSHGSPSTVATLISKGWFTAERAYGPRGGEYLRLTPVQRAIDIVTQHDAVGERAQAEIDAYFLAHHDTERALVRAVITVLAGGREYRYDRRILTTDGLHALVSTFGLGAIVAVSARSARYDAVTTADWPLEALLAA